MIISNCADSIKTKGFRSLAWGRHQLGDLISKIDVESKWLEWLKEKKEQNFNFFHVKNKEELFNEIIEMTDSMFIPKEKDCDRIEHFSFDTFIVFFNQLKIGEINRELWELNCIHRYIEGLFYRITNIIEKRKKR
jgi:hypothetical protein